MPGMHSMTGFGTAAGESSRYRVTADIRSVNHRSLDLVVRTREPYRSSEKALRDLIKSRVGRGRVELFLDVSYLGEETGDVELDRELATRVLAAVAEIPDVGPLAAGDLLRVPGVVNVTHAQREWLEDDEKLLMEVATRALDELAAAREREGAKLERDLEEGAAMLTAASLSLRARRGAVVEQSRESLQERVSALLEGAHLDEARLEQEVALLVEKSDVEEELERLSAHIEHLGEAFAAVGPVGKRIDFLLQEVMRELNTVGAKCRDLEMSRTVLEARLAAEQMREQVQNVE